MKTIKKHIFNQARAIERTVYGAVPAKESASIGGIHAELNRIGKNMNRSALDAALMMLVEKGWIKKVSCSSQAGHVAEYQRIVCVEQKTQVVNMSVKRAGKTQESDNPEQRLMTAFSQIRKGIDEAEEAYLDVLSKNSAQADKLKDLKQLQHLLSRINA